MTMSPARRRDCVREDAVERCWIVLERAVLHGNLNVDAHSDGDA